MGSTADIIKDSVSMRDVLEMYGFRTSRYGRIPCPLHNGKDKNFAYKDRHFKCYVCGKSGTVIDFVMELFGLDFVEAVKRLNADFHLGLSNERPSDDELNALRERRLAKQRAEERWWAEYKKLATEHLYWHEVSVYFAPERPETYGTAYIHPLYAEAMKRLPYIEYLIEEHENKKVMLFATEDTRVLKNRLSVHDRAV